MQRHAGAGHWKRPSHTHVVCALVGSGTLLTAEPQLQHPADMCPVRPLLVCVFLVLWESPGKSRGQDYSVCPITTPCHCETHDVINCAKRRLKKLPFFLNFYFVWADLDLSDNLLPQLPAQGLQGVKVKKLTLSENILTLVHPLAFSGTQGLEELRLAHNYLSYVPPDMFTHLPSLKTLDLSYNRYAHVSRLTSHVSRLTSHVSRLMCHVSRLTSQSGDQAETFRAGTRLSCSDRGPG